MLLLAFNLSFKNSKGRYYCYSFPRTNSSSSSSFILFQNNEVFQTEARVFLLLSCFFTLACFKFLWRKWPPTLKRELNLYTYELTDRHLVLVYCSIIIDHQVCLRVWELHTGSPQVTLKCPIESGAKEGAKTYFSVSVLWGRDKKVRINFIAPEEGR